MKVLYKKIRKCEDCPHDKIQEGIITHYKCSLIVNQDSVTSMRLDIENIKDNCPLGDDGVDDAPRQLEFEGIDL